MAITEDIDFIKTTSSHLDDAKVDYPNSFIHIHETNKDELYIGEDRVTDNFNIGGMSDNTTTRELGGLKASTLGALKNKTMSQIIMEMICPLTYPTHTNPSVSVSYSGAKLVAVGSTLPTRGNITTSSSRGAWSDGTPYAGVCGEISVSMSPDNWGGATVEGTYTITGTGTFAAGPTPKDSHGNPYTGSEYAGGSKSASVSIVSVYPIKINDGSSIDTMVEHLVNYNSEQTLRVTIPSETYEEEDKFQIWLPYQSGTLTVKKYNSYSKAYDIPITMETNGTDGVYTKYIREVEAGVINTGDTQYEIKLKKN